MSVTDDDKMMLDRRTFKALASSTRVDILKALDGTQRTVSELARVLSMNKATMYQHLEQLREVKLVRRMDGEERLKTVKKGPHAAPVAGPPRKWVYYRLTWKGKNIVQPGKVRFAIMLGIIGVICIGVIALYMVNVYTGPGGDGEFGAKKVDDMGPTFDMWDSPSPNTDTNDYGFSVLISDDPFSGKVTGLKEESIKVYYGVGQNEGLSSPNLVEWTEVSHTRSGERCSATITDLDFAGWGGKFLYLKVTANDYKGNYNESVRQLYIVKFLEADLIFGDNGVYGGDNGVYGDHGVYISGGGGHAGVFVFGVQVSNIGDTEAGPFRVSIYTTDPDLDDDGLVDSNLRLSRYTIVTFHVNSLGVGEIINLSQEVPVTTINEMDKAEGGGGGGAVYVVLDTEDRVKEVEEANNIQRVTDVPATFSNELGRDPKPPAKMSSGEGAAPGFELLGLLAAAALALVIRHRRSKREV